MPESLAFFNFTRRLKSRPAHSMISVRTRKNHGASQSPSGRVLTGLSCSRCGAPPMIALSFPEGFNAKLCLMDIS